jgi:pilus assembly protein CpaB
VIRRVLKNRLFVSLFCLAVAGTVAFGLLPGLYAQKTATVMVWTASSSIFKGTQITQSMLSATEVGAFGVPDDVLEATEDIVGKYASVDILPEDIMRAAKLQEFQVDSVLDQLAKDQKRLVTVTLQTSAAGLASHLQPGDIVQVAAYVQEREHLTETGWIMDRDQVVLFPELEAVQVYDVENAKVESVQVIRNREERTGVNYDPVPKTATLIVSSEQLKPLLEAEYIGNIHLIFVSREEFSWPAR